MSESEKNKSVAFFNLDKNYDENKNNDPIFRAKTFYEHGKKYHDASFYLYNSGNFDYIEVYLVNAAFSAELFLKSLIYNLVPEKIEEMKSCSHNLQKLYLLLPKLEKDFIKDNVFKGAPYNGNFDACLKGQKNAFERYRYSCEVTAMSGDMYFLLGFSHILEYVSHTALIQNGLLDK